jgi:hypothetical protein
MVDDLCCTSNEEANVLYGRRDDELGHTTRQYRYREEQRPLPVCLSENLQIVRIIGALFLSNALIFTIVYWCKDWSEYNRLLVFWACGVILSAIYYIVVRVSIRMYVSMHQNDSSDRVEVNERKYLTNNMKMTEAPQRSHMHTHTHF